MNFDFVSVDFQYDFVDKNGINFNKGKSSNFIQDTLYTFLLKENIQVSEIISDYRLPRGKSKNESCVPGTIGFKSLLPDELRKGEPWIKCMHNPIWTRANIGIPDVALGVPYQDSIRFDEWLKKQINNKNVVLFGLTADCCILQVASELYFRGYDVYIVYEATDPMNERLPFKDNIMFHSTLQIYAKVITFDELKNMIGDI